MVLEIFNNESVNSIFKYKLEYKIEYKLGDSILGSEFLTLMIIN